MDAKIYFGGKNGLTVVHNDSVFSTVIAPPTTVTGITLLHKGKIFREFIEIPDTIRIPHGSYAVKVEFSLPDFNRPERNQYRYSLSQPGKKTEWNELNTSNSVILEDSARETIFSLSWVRPVTENGIQNPMISSSLVEVPIWQSKTAYTIYFILILSLIVFSVPLLDQTANQV